MATSKQGEGGMNNQSRNESIERDEEDKGNQSPLSFKSLLWHGGSVYDAWFSCASNQVFKLRCSPKPFFFFFPFVFYSVC